ncbi:DMT family transporter [Lutibacter sp. B2]|nr:DMT family transporter [Lutibacter sp. B2]
MNNKTKAIIYMLGSSFFFALMAALVKLSGDLPTVQKIFCRNLVSCFVAGGIAIHHKKKLFGKRENQKYLLLRSLLGTIGMICYFYSIDHMLLSDSAMLNKINPFFVSILACLFLKEKFSKIQIPALIVAFIGALFIIKPQFNLEMLPSIVAVVGAMFAAGAYTMVRFLGDKEEFYTIVFYFSFFSTAVTFPLTIMSYTPMSTTQILLLIGIGIVASAAQFTMTIAYRFAPAGEISILNYTNVLFAGILGFILWRNIPDFMSVIGYCLIIGVAFIIYKYNKVKG